jgi:hypothetical protein
MRARVRVFVCVCIFLVYASCVYFSGVCVVCRQPPRETVSAYWRSWPARFGGTHLPTCPLAHMHTYTQMQFFRLS